MALSCLWAPRAKGALQPGTEPRIGLWEGGHGDPDGASTGLLFWENVSSSLGQMEGGRQAGEGATPGIPLIHSST